MSGSRERCRLKARLAASLLWFCAISCGHEGAPAPPPQGGTSLLLITIDTVRADHLGCYGATEAATPNLDQIARQGVRFKAARTCVPLTLPSHVTMLTGLLPPCHGIHDNAVSHLRPEAVTLAELLAARGYRTGAFVSAFVLASKFGLAQGFEVYSEVPPRTLMSGLVEERRGDETLAEAMQWFRSLPTDAPFFLWLHLFDAHSPYQPPPPFDQRFADRAYDGEIAFVDSLVGQLLEVVRAARSDVLTAVLADHGEGLGEHGELTHGLFVYDATMHIPWLMSGPGLPAGRAIDAPVASVDLFPTLAAQLALPVPDGVQGRDLTALIRGEPASARPIYMESYYGHLNFRWSPILAMTDGAFKVIDAPRAELYDLNRDARELQDLATSERARLERMRKDVRLLAGSLRCGAALSDAYQGTAEDRAALRALGYVGDSSAAADLPLPGRGADPKDMIESLGARDRAMSLFQENRIDEAVSVLLPALAKDPHNAMSLEYLGVCYARQNRLQEAIDTLQKAVAIRPDRLDAQYALAYCLDRLGKPKEALARLQKCLELNPSFLKAAKLAGEIHERTPGEKAQAAEQYRYFLARWKGDEATAVAIKAALARVEG